MVEILQILQGIIEQGTIFGILVSGIYIASRIIKFDNLSVEGAFGLGGAINAVLINQNINPWLALFFATIGGGISGVVTGIINTKLKINTLISGIIVTTGLFSVILKIAGSNMILNNKKTVFSLLPSIYYDCQKTIILIIFVIILIYSLMRFLKTEIGFLLYALGDNPQMLLNLGKNVDNYKMFGLAISNGMAALSSALYVQYVGYFSIWMGVGILIIGLAGMILGESLSDKFGFTLIIGSILYQVIIALTFELQIDQDWNKLLTAILIIILLILKESVKKK